MSIPINCSPRGSLRGVPLGVVVAAAILFNPLAAVAHHSPAGFDTSKSKTITAVVKRYEWFNPHVYITVETTTESGQKIELEVESFAPSAMKRLGWTKETLRVGDVLSITGSPGRAENSRGFLAGTIKRADATLLSTQDFAKQFTPAKDAPKFAAKSLEGVWMAQPNMQVLTQVGFPSPAQMTSEGAQLFKSFDERAVSPAVNCIPNTPPITMVMPDMKRLAVKDGLLHISVEFDDAKRTIRLDQVTHDGAIPSHQGHSIAKWEGKTLVIDTTHFAYHALGNGFGLPSGGKKHLTERLTPSEDGTTLTYRFEMSDPEFLKAPKVGEVKWAYRPDLKFESDPCNLDSARRFIKH